MILAIFFHQPWLRVQAAVLSLSGSGYALQYFRLASFLRSAHSDTFHCAVNPGKNLASLVRAGENCCILLVQQCHWGVPEVLMGLHGGCSQLRSTQGPNDFQRLCFRSDHYSNWPRAVMKNRREHFKIQEESEKKESLTWKMSASSMYRFGNKCFTFIMLLKNWGDHSPPNCWEYKKIITQS